MSSKTSTVLRTDGAPQISSQTGLMCRQRTLFFVYFKLPLPRICHILRANRYESIITRERVDSAYRPDATVFLPTGDHFSSPGSAV